MSNFFFSQSAFKRFVLQTCKNMCLFVKGSMLMTVNFLVLSLHTNVSNDYRNGYIIPEIWVVFSSTGRRPASLCHGLLSVVRPSGHPAVRLSGRALTFSLNIFFSETTYRILIKFLRNVPAMVLFRIS